MTNKIKVYFVKDGEKFEIKPFSYSQSNKINNVRITKGGTVHKETNNLKTRIIDAIKAEWYSAKLYPKTYATAVAAIILVAAIVGIVFV